MQNSPGENLCELEIANKRLEIEFTANKGRQGGEGDKEERGTLIEEMRSHLCAAEDLSL